MSTTTLGQLLYSFFEDYLKCQKGLSTATIKTYRDGIRLFLQFVSNDKGRKITRLALADLSADRVVRFLNALEVDRRNHIRTRNQRLTALRGLFEYLAYRLPEWLAEAERVAAIPTKRVPPPATGYLERDEIEAVFAKLPRQGRFALRDRALLLFLYNTGARVQEAADLRVGNLELDAPPRVHLHGKGDKWRTCPLWQETTQQLRQLLEQQGALNKTEHAVFVSHQGRALTRFGIYKIVRRHTQHLAKRGPGAEHGISPHCLRHTTAVHLLEAGVEVNVIRSWLGHISLETTNRYAELTLQMKVAALEVCEPPTSSSEVPQQKPVWRDDPELLHWLESL